MSTQFDSTAIPKHPQVGTLAPVSPDKTLEQEADERADQQTWNQTSFFDFINDTLDAVDSIDREAILDIRKVMVKSHQYYDGKQYGHVDNRGVWHDDPTIPGDVTLVDNQYKYHVDTALMEMVRATPSLDVAAADSSNTELVEAAKVAQSKVEEHRKRILTPSFVQSEAMNKLLKTIGIRYTYWDGAAGRKELVPITETQIVPPISATVCAVCSYPMDTPETPDDKPDDAALLPACPHCGSTRTKVLAGQPTKRQVVTGYRKLAIGEPRSQPIDPLQVTVYLGARNIAGTPYLKFKQMVMRSVLEQAFKGRVIPSTGTKSLELQYQQGIERSVDGAHKNFTVPEGNSGGSHAKEGGRQFEPIENEQCWLDPHLYAQYRSKEPQNLVNGMVLEPGQDPLEIFPDGMYVNRVSRTILDMWPESKNKKWSAAVFGLRPGGFYGSGTSALHSDQDVINMIRSLSVANANANAVPREFVNTDYLEGNKLSNDPTEVIQVSTLPQGGTIAGNVYHQAQAQGLAGEVYGISSDAKNAMQAKLGTFSAMGTDQPDLKGALSTATGISILRDNAVGRMGPSLYLGTEMDVEQAYQFLEHEQANPNTNRYKLAQGKMGETPKGDLGYTMAGVKALLNCDIRNDLIITPVEDSWMPITRGQKIQNLKEFLPFTDPKISSEIQALAADAFSISLNIGGWTAEQREAQRRLQKFAAVSAFLEPQLNPGAENEQVLACEACGAEIDPAAHELAAQSGQPWACPNCGSSETETVNPAVELVLTQSGCPMDMLMDNHDAFINFYTDWNVSDEAQESSTLLRRVVHRRTEQHYQGKMQYAKYVRGLELESQAPEAAASLITSGAQAEQGMNLASRAADAQDVRDLHKAAVIEEAGGGILRKEN